MEKRRADRRNSTAFTAPITYGPALKSFGWVSAHPRFSKVLIAQPQVEEALDAFEALITDRLQHPAFCTFDEVTVDAEVVRRWSDAWDFSTVTKAEAKITIEMLTGAVAPPALQAGSALALAAAAKLAGSDVAAVRGAMAQGKLAFRERSDLADTSEVWRRIQTRQLFRLALEALLYWITISLESGGKTSSELVSLFMSEIPARAGAASARDWMHCVDLTDGPTELLSQLRQVLSDQDESIPAMIISALQFCLQEPAYQPYPFERSDRLPLSRARREYDERSAGEASLLVQHILDAWVLAQHTYWSVWRGLADARARGKSIRRMKVVLEEEGWTLAPGVVVGNAPLPTPDRLETFLSLANESGMLAVQTDVAPEVRSVWSENIGPL